MQAQAHSEFATGGPAFENEVGEDPCGAKGHWIDCRSFFPAKASNSTALEQGWVSANADNAIALLEVVELPR